MSYTLAQALYLLSRNPDVQDEARARVLQAGDAGKSAGDPFVLNILHETMRLFPAVPFSSKVSESRSIEVEGVTIPAQDERDVDEDRRGPERGGLRGRPAIQPEPFRRRTRRRAARRVHRERHAVRRGSAPLHRAPPWPSICAHVS